MSAKRNKFQVIILILSLLISPFFYNINEFTPKEWDIALFAFSPLIGLWDATLYALFQ